MTAPRPLGQIRAAMASSAAPSRVIAHLSLAALLGAPFPFGPAWAADLPDWENPQVVGINNLDPHALGLHPRGMPCT